jgi:lipoprotein-releasing system permease protein
MIGILKALWATDWTVQKIFLRHSFLLPLPVLSLGQRLRYVFLYLQETTGFIKLKEGRLLPEPGSLLKLFGGKWLLFV